MKRVGIGLALLVIAVGVARAQFLGGIFSQGATELKNSTAELAVLEALSGSTDEGYAIFEDGLTNVGTIHGAEYGLHQTYFASLVGVNPAVAGMPEVQEIITLASWIGNAFPVAIDRWRGSGRLVAAELEVAEQVEGNIGDQLSSELGELNNLLTAGIAMMGDAERIGRIRVLDAAAREQAGLAQDFIAGGDRLVAERQNSLP
jgi:hypothetical protein